MNIYLDLFLTFAKVGVCTFGGGYAMLPILQREVVEKKGWSTDEELTDYIAVGQCALTGINAAVVALIASSVLKLGRSNLKDSLSVCIFLAGLVLAFFLKLSPVLIIICAGLLGYVARTLAGRREGER